MEGIVDKLYYFIAIDSKILQRIWISAGKGSVTNGLVCKVKIDVMQSCDFVGVWFEFNFTSDPL